ncbi:stage III sporulation protein AF [Symbiobacterium thermophilum]|uniref:Stage III sporulation protein AF n=1 Tax=Symbiobacterium thermophilum (strain DSM 24528 / JCM 14929 / IAM 14863 / T) TaxID=292459 RepID=Q67NA1_SYMTH|nr:stage III sporulation protein AF [Symbiobacterium thermophilum]BAD40842.1 stage III sporulation protein AF [Symbiobacterium thermophilum IAM 14863]
MAALTEWVRGLVVLVVLASLLEMLLPMGGMKRFVRLAMGLVIMLGIVRPILGLLGGQVAVDPEPWLEPTTSLPSVSEIARQAERFQARTQALLLEELQDRIRRAAEEAARSVEGVAEAAAAVELAGGPRLETVSLERVTVTVVLGSRFGQVRPVAPVRIGGEEQAAGGGAGTRARAPTPAETPLAETVRRQVAEQLGLTDASQVTVWIESVDAAGR